MLSLCSVDGTEGMCLLIIKAPTTPHTSSLQCLDAQGQLSARLEHLILFPQLNGVHEARRYNKNVCGYLYDNVHSEPRGYRK